MPNDFAPCYLETIEDVTRPEAMSARKAALTYAASSTHGGIRDSSSSLKTFSSPDSGFLSCSIRSEVCLASSGFDTTPSLR